MAESKAQVAERKLKAAQDRARRRKLGKPLGLSDDGLEQAAAVTEADKESAFAFWRQHAPQQFKDLLDAEVVE